MNLNQMARDTGLRPPRRPLSDAVKLEYVKWFAIEHQPDWESGEAYIVLHLHLFDGLDKAFKAAREFVEARERKRMDELLAALMSTGAHGQIRSPDRIPLTDEQVKELNERGSLEVVMNPGSASVDEWVKSIERDLDEVEVPAKRLNWRTRVAEYFGFR